MNLTPCRDWRILYGLYSHAELVSLANLAVNFEKTMFSLQESIKVLVDGLITGTEALQMKN